MPIRVQDQHSVGQLACIDLASSDLLFTASILRQACLDSGFFYVVNHGVDCMEQALAESRKFFGLATEEKMKVARDNKNRGYTPFLDETLDPSNQSKDLLPGWRETMEKYYKQLLLAGRKITRLLALALNLELTYFENPGIMDCPLAYIRLLHYSGEASNPGKGIYGAGAHSDYGMITLLATDGVPGLQICKNKDADPQVWEDVQPVKGAFVVNLGDMLERWSNGLFRSTLHRVVLSGEERYSIAFFLDPNFDCLVECLPACCSPTNPPRFPPITSGHYLIERYKLSYKS